MTSAINILKHEPIKAVLMLLIVIAGGFIMTSAVTAQSITIDEPDTCDGEGCLGLDPIEIPTFLEIGDIQNYSIGSYVAVGFNIIFVALTLLWVFLVVRAGVQVIQSQGSEDALVAARERITGVFMSITFLFGFFALLIVIASFFGLGEFWRWPQYLSFCEDGRIYYAHVIDTDPIGDGGIAPGEVSADESCFGDSGESRSGPR